MALHKRYEIVPSDPDNRCFLSVQDFRHGRDDGSYVQISIKDDDADPQMAELGWDTQVVWLTTEEMGELHAVLSSMLGLVTAEVEAAVGDY